MNFFKHVCGSYRSGSLLELMSEHGVKGYGFWYFLIDHYAEHYSSNEDEYVKLDLDYVCRTLRLKPRTVLDLMQRCTQLGMITYLPRTYGVSMKIHNFLKYMDKDFKYNRYKRVANALAATVDKEVRSKKKEVRSNITLNRKLESSTQVVASDASEKKKNIVAIYCDHFKTRYGTYPPIAGKESGILSRLGKELGYDKTTVLLETYFKMGDSLFLQRRHDVGTFRLSLNAITHFGETGMLINKKMSEQFETLSGQVVDPHVIKKQKYEKELEQIEKERQEYERARIEHEQKKEIDHHQEDVE